MSEQEVAAPRPRKETKAEFNYRALIENFPVPGGGGAHHALFKAGALAYKAGIDVERAIADVRAHISKTGGRKVSEGEIMEGVEKGFRTAVEEASGIKVKKEAMAIRRIATHDDFVKVAKNFRGITVEDIMRKSPVPLDFPEEEAGWRTLEALYDPSDILFIGPVKCECLREDLHCAGDWVKMLKGKEAPYPIIIPNPLTGEAADVKAMTHKTFFGDNCVKSFRHAVVEMDKESIEDQLAFWSWAALPVRALIMSGGASIHAWVDVSCRDKEEWEKEIEGCLYPSYLIPLGHDKACINEARKSRFPGHMRNDQKVHNVRQKLIWLSPEGKAVCE